MAFQLAFPSGSASSGHCQSVPRRLCQKLPPKQHTKPHRHLAPGLSPVQVQGPKPQHPQKPRIPAQSQLLPHQRLVLPQSLARSPQNRGQLPLGLALSRPDLALPLPEQAQSRQLQQPARNPRWFLLAPSLQRCPKPWQQRHNQNLEPHSDTQTLWVVLISCLQWYGTGSCSEGPGFSASARWDEALSIRHCLLSHAILSMSQLFGGCFYNFLWSEHSAFALCRWWKYVYPESLMPEETRGHAQVFMPTSGTAHAKRHGSCTNC